MNLSSGHSDSDEDAVCWPQPDVGEKERKEGRKVRIIPDGRRVTCTGRGAAPKLGSDASILVFFQRGYISFGFKRPFTPSDICELLFSLKTGLTGATRCHAQLVRPVAAPGRWSLKKGDGVTQTARSLETE